ncbi:MAG: hypothetical protein CVU38_18030 [Chloroflexi bacterium HGW-Chloroflexi-1]|nr:MAG: hypothetical protein CVU38_18030 [Chloroflexi bacterium HGW-Chloroflexi-1]
MTDYFYPTALRQVFTNRERELALLDLLCEQAQAGKPQRLALSGLRRIGKTVLLKEFIVRTLAAADGVQPVYVNCEEITTSPENFAVGLVGSVCYWVLTHGQTNPRPFFKLDSLLLEALPHPSAAIRETLGLLQTELRAQTPDRPFLLRLTFDLAETWAKENGRKLLLILDEFPEYQTLANYPETRNAVALFRSFCQAANEVSVILAGSAISVMERLMADPTSPLFLQFQRLSLEPFSPDASAALARKLLADLPAPADPAVIAEIRRLSGGHPYYIAQLCDRLARLALLAEAPVDATLARQAFLAETLSPSGGIYGFCKYVYDLSLQRARGYGTIKTILQLLAEEEPLSIARVARRLRVSDPTAREYLRWLLEVDLIQEVEGGYAHRDPVLRFWIAHTAVGIEVGPFPRREEVRDLLARLEEGFQRTSTEPGIAKESQIRELMEQFAGQQVDGAIFGAAGSVQLPRVLAEADSTGSATAPEESVTADESWVAEIKWRGRLAGKKDLARLEVKARALAARPWFISKEGFTPEALAYAHAAGIRISAREDIERLTRAVGETTR